MQRTQRDLACCSVDTIAGIDVPAEGVAAGDGSGTGALRGAADTALDALSGADVTMKSAPRIHPPSDDGTPDRGTVSLLRGIAFRSMTERVGGTP